MKTETNNKSSLGLSPNEPSIIENALRAIIRVIEKIAAVLSNIAHKLSLLILFLLMLLTTFDVAGRYFFSNPIKGTFELTGLTLAVMVFFSLAATQLAKEHISIDFIVTKYSAKVQHGISAFFHFILTVMLIFSTWQMGKYMQQIWRGNETTADLGLPLYIFIILAIIGMGIYTITIFLEFLRSMLKVVERHES